MQNKPPSATAPTPTIRRRLTALTYEAFLVAAVLMFATVLFMLATFNSHAPLAEYGRKLWLFLAAGAYFVFCWTDSGHTLAMKTWRIKLVTRAGGKVPFRTAALRYLLAWGWFVPAIVIGYAFRLTGDYLSFSPVLLAGMAVWALTAFLDRDRQFLHDRLAGTRLVLLPKAGAAAPLQQGAPT